MLNFAVSCHNQKVEFKECWPNSFFFSYHKKSVISHEVHDVGHSHETGIVWSAEIDRISDFSIGNRIYVGAYMIL